MKKIIIPILAIALCGSKPAKASMFGEENAVLAQILANAVQQLTQLRNILQTERDNVNLIRDLNRGINDSLYLMKTISPNSNPGIYKDWEKVSDAIYKLESIYGVAVESRDRKVQNDTDQSIAEAVSMNNTIYKYTKEIDEIGERIKNYSHSVSPGGAAKLTAQSMGVMINLQNEMLRTQASGLKLQAQSLAIQNRKDKERTRQMLASAEGLNTALQSAKPQFKLPKFE